MATVGGTRFRTAALLRHFSIAAAILSPAARATAADPTPQELAAKLRETLTGLHTIEMEYRQEIVSETGENGRETISRTLNWLADGERGRIAAFTDGEMSGWWGFDGRHGYRVGFRPNEPGVPREIITATTPPAVLTIEYTPAYWLGLKVSEIGDSLTLDRLLAGEGLLENEETSIVGEETWEGLPVFRVKLGERMSQNSGLWTHTAVICPGRDGLPVEIIVAPSEINPLAERINRVTGPFRFTVSEFREVHDEALQKTRWLPWRMSLKNKLCEWKIDVTLARVNHSIPAGEFDPPPPQPGTNLIDETVPGRQRQVTVYMPEIALARQANDLVAAVRPETPATADVAAAVAVPPNPGRWGRIAAWAGSFLLLAAGLVYAYRSLRTG